MKCPRCNKERLDGKVHKFEGRTYCIHCCPNCIRERNFQPWRFNKDGSRKITKVAS